MKLPNRLYSAAQVRELDRIAIEEFKISSLSLMQHAGAVALETLKQFWPDQHNLLIFCGVGNNAGDGYVLAKLAQQSGLQVRVVQIGQSPDNTNTDAGRCYQAMLQTGVEPEPFTDDCLNNSRVIIDALFGTGLSRELEAEYLSAVRLINNSGLPVLALDVPSGIDSTTGKVWGQAVRANATVSFIGLKRGLFTASGAEHAGTVLFNDLNVPAEIYQRLSSTIETISYQEAKALLLPRSVNSHKGDFGHLLVVGGEHGMQGAARLAAEAAARSGAGMVSVATRQRHATSLAMGRPELMVHGVESIEALQALLARVDVVCLGPGLGQGDWGNLMMEGIKHVDLPIVMDADALNLLAASPNHHANRVITPHPGEAGRLLNRTTEAVQQDRFQSIKNLHSRYGGTVVLKGHGSLVYGRSEVTAVCTDGNPGMATAGMGDVLSGIIAALLAQGMNPETAAMLGVCVHAAAGDRAAESAGQRGLMAMDLMPLIQQCVNPQ